MRLPSGPDKGQPSAVGNGVTPFNGECPDCPRNCRRRAAFRTSITSVMGRPLGNTGKAGVSVLTRKSGYPPDGVNVLPNEVIWHGDHRRPLRLNESPAARPFYRYSRTQSERACLESAICQSISNAILLCSSAVAAGCDAARASRDRSDPDHRP